MKFTFKLFILEIAEYQLPLALLYNTGVAALHCKHNGYKVTQNAIRL